MIRKATLADLGALQELAINHAKQYPYLIPNKESIKKLITECISSAVNFAFVSEYGGRVCGALLAIAHNNLWAQKKSSTVLAFVCNESWDGSKLLNQYAEWVDERPVIRRAGFQFDIEVDQRVLKMLERAGFKKHGGCYLIVK
jgi:hypothetical protein